jgi:mlo protein
MKSTIFDEQMAKALKKWHKAVKKKQKKEVSQDPSSETTSTDTTTTTTEASQLQQHKVPVRFLHRYKTIAHVGTTWTLSDSEGSDLDNAEGLSSSQTRRLLMPSKQRSLDTSRSELCVDVEAAP